VNWLYLYLALAPVLAIALYVYWKDKHEKEPVGVLVICFFLGVLMGLPAGYWNSFAFALFGFDLDMSNGLVDSFFMAFFVVGLGEELLKYLVLVLYAFRRPSFNEPFDGIVYAVMISLGFATLENVIYVAEGGVGVAFIRTFTAVPMHAAFAIFMGYHVGLAKFQDPQKQARTCRKGLFCAVLFHGGYDFFLFQDDSVLLGLLVFPLMILAFILSRKSMREHLARSPFRG
jgi:RsiW-degrading membrane proteinase PrsW (M82 family)